MSTMPDLPTILISSSGSPQVRSASRNSTTADHVQTVSGATVAGICSESDRHYNISERPDSPQGCRPPPSRCSTKELPLHLDSGSQALSSQVKVGSGIQRSQTDTYSSVSNPSRNNSSDPPAELVRSSTAGITGSRNSKREPGLRSRIYSAMEGMGRVGWRTPKTYLPEKELFRLMTDQRIEKALGQSSTEVVEFAKENPKVLAITVLVHLSKTSRCRAMKAFQSNGFTDDCLPVESVFGEDECLVPFNYETDNDSDTSSSTICAFEISPQCKHRKEENAFHGQPWTKQFFKDFSERQWSFLVPRIKVEKFEHYFRNDIILPFESNEEVVTTRVRHGNFGIVRQAMMLGDYQTAIKTTERVIPVAIKEMKLHPGDEYDDFKDWQRETNALKKFNEFHNPHIVRGIGAFVQKQEYFIVMEWADGGDLGTLWKSTPEPHLNLTEVWVAQFLEQFRGLATALEQMHVYPPDGDLPGLAVPKQEQSDEARLAESRLLNQTNLAPDVETPEAQDPKFLHSEFIELETAGDESKSSEPSIERQHRRDQDVHFKDTESQVEIIGLPQTTENWRHGDLKPDNILSFRAEDSSCWLGRLKLADLGRAKQHMDKTGKRVSTAEIFSTLPYDPPEVWTSLDKGRSRLVDIWAFGCVLLESIIWLLFGFDELSTFRTGVTGIGSLYWSVQILHTKTAKLRDSTFEWINRLLQEDPECQARESGSALRDLVLLIKNKLLVIKLPVDSDEIEDGCRINSKTLVRELDAIIEKGKKDPTYLFSGQERAGVAIPKAATVKEDKIQFLSPHVELNGANVAQTRTSAPWEFRSANRLGKIYDSYIHDFDDKWQYVNDNPFASQVLQRADIEVNQLLLTSTISLLCDTCRSLDLNAPDFEIKRPLAELRRRKEEQRCEFCAILLRTAEKYGHSEWVEFDRVASGLRINGSPGLPALTIRGIREESNSSSGHHLCIQIGLPRIPKGGSLAHFGIMRAWLDDCDKNHIECRAKRLTSFPTRVIDVGTLESPSLRLVESSSLSTTEKKSLRYIALSYPWGTNPPHQHFVTDSGVIGDHRREIPNTLPKTLADAVTTTRSLKVRYLWIDSLCIIQGSNGDFAEEAGRMEAVFSSAYCVIAASSAEGSSSGFLSRKSRREIHATKNAENEQPNPVCFRDRAGTDQQNEFIIVDEPFDDFDRDVLRGPLNQRGWVFQERALARRTIHFTNNQTYWECGDGIRCETLTKMRNKSVGFLGDPNFPNYGMHGSKGGDIAFYEDLYERYSRLSFSKMEDRPFAISGLEQRLAQALKDKGGSDRGFWGIFDAYWGRGLLWRRGADVDKMIRLTTGASGGDPAPSWSWEGYSGGITFMKPEPRTVEWLVKEVTLPWSQSKLAQSHMTTTSYHGERCLKGVAHDFTIPDENETDHGRYDIIYDDEANRSSRGPLKVLVIGRMNVEGRSREKVRNYVLVIARKQSAPANVYERIGAGYIDGSLIIFEKNVKSVLAE